MGAGTDLDPMPGEAGGSLQTPGLKPRGLPWTTVLDHGPARDLGFSPTPAIWARIGAFSPTAPCIAGAFVCMALRLPPYQPLPPPTAAGPLLEVPILSLRPTQLCVGLAEVRSRQADFGSESGQQRRDYLGKKPVPLVRSSAGDVWMVDRHHRLRALAEIDPQATAFGYVVLQVTSPNPTDVLKELHHRGWLYLYDGRGAGPLSAAALPQQLSGLQDDPYRSLVWKLKKEKVIEPAPLIPFHEFRWGAWLRSRAALPPFSSEQLDPALPVARALARSSAASHLAGWTGRR